MAYVRDRNDEPITLRMGFAVDGIIEVSRVFPVDRDQGEHAEIFALIRFSRIHAVAPALRLAQSRIGEFVWQVEARDRCLSR